MTIALTINGNEIQAEEGMTILEAAQENEIYIPRLCYHPSLGSSHGMKPMEVIFREDLGGGEDGGESSGLQDDGSGPDDGFDGCRLCLVEVKGREGLVTACDTIIEAGMMVETETDKVREARRDNLAGILKDHPHACLQCAQQEGCSRTQCSTNVPEDERCCPLLGHCELQKIAGYVGIRQDLTKYEFRDLPKHTGEPLYDRDYNLCIGCLRCVRACRDLRGIDTLGFVYHEGTVVVGATKSSMYAESDCRFCGACVEVCPTGTLTDKDLPQGEKEDVLVPCIAGCPAGIDIPRYIRLIAQGKYSEAGGVIRERIPFPGIIGRICFHPCEDVCRRGELNHPMAICDLKWFAAENEGTTFEMGKRTKDLARPSTGKKVAVVGSGPSGLSAAYYLALAGHAVTVFEKEEEIGGMLRYAIPDYRLLPATLDEELKIFSGLDVEFRTGTPIGEGLTLSRLRDDNQAVFLGTGACLSKRIPVDGSDIRGVEWGLDFLRDVKTKNVTEMSGRVVVIGGGNVAMDVARSCIRLGAEEVRLACLESDAEMPAHDWEIQEAKEEGIIMHPSWGPSRILGNGGDETGDEAEKGPGSVTGIELVKCTSVFDERGNFAPSFDDCVETTIETDKVIFAVGQTSDLSCTEDVETSRGTISVGTDQQASIEGIFAGGEAARGPASVVEAVADGAAAAAAIDTYLGGDGNIHPSFVGPANQDPEIGTIEDFADMDRVGAPKSNAETRKQHFEMVANCYEEQQAQQEAVRCLQCDLRLMIRPVTLPPERWFELTEENVEQVPAEEGVFQLMDEDKMVIAIKGSQDLKADLEEKLGSDTKARYFEFEVDPMYTKRESELIQQFLQQYGKMPEGDGGDDDLDDLF